MQSKKPLSVSQVGSEDGMSEYGDTDRLDGDGISLWQELKDETVRLESRKSSSSSQVRRIRDILSPLINNRVVGQHWLAWLSRGLHTSWDQPRGDQGDALNVHEQEEDLHLCPHRGQEVVTMPNVFSCLLYLNIFTVSMFNIYFESFLQHIPIPN